MIGNSSSLPLLEMYLRTLQYFDYNFYPMQSSQCQKIVCNTHRPVKMNIASKAEINKSPIGKATQASRKEGSELSTGSSIEKWSASRPTDDVF
ncbi:hypothetical protein D5086_023634 [Populus alba]|uniref:Uncharacterized protein n=1 Tax=Populus alba TaxID=43335 RepID=A0ACC4BAB7_POPAL